MRVATIGGGLVASAISRALPETIILGHDAVDVTSQDSIVNALRQHKPDVVVYCAAKHNLAWCEANATATFDVNAKGVERVARLVPTVYISSDYVFDNGGPHDEALPGRQPRSVYGRSKLAGELATLEHDGIVVRVSAVFDDEFTSRKGLSFPEMVATKFDNLRFPDDQVFSPTYARDAAERIVSLAGLFDANTLPFGIGTPNGIYHAANAGSVHWRSFAQETLKMLGRRYQVQGFAAKDPLRPTNSALRSARLPPLPHWLDALQRWSIARQARLEREAVSPLRG